MNTQHPRIVRFLATDHWALALVITVYVALAALFALTTPPWQNPDEPAHYNYVAYVASERRLPVLQMGDYDEGYLQRLKDERFRPGLSVAGVRYEFHQPPLYYLLAAPVYWLSGGNLLALRLFNVALGAGVILLVFACARIIVPTPRFIALGAAAFAAFLPMHLALMAAVNNDVLAELVIAGGCVMLLRWQTTGHRPLGLVIVSLCIGLGFLTKATAYVLLPVALLTVTAVLVIGRISGPVRLSQYAFLLAPAMLLGLPLWIRNSLVYGNLDFLGLAWHDVVVSGQPTTAGWIAAHGWVAYWQRALEFTAKSFWGVFGWLGVFMDARIYTYLFILSGMAAMGVMLWLPSQWRMAAERWRTTAASHSYLALLLLGGGVLAAYGWYNLGFIQHQGRYLLPALPAWSLLFAVGWWAVLERRASGIAGGLLLIAAGMGLGTFDRWTVLLCGLVGAGLLLHGVLARYRWGHALRCGLYCAIFLSLIVLDTALPFLYIIPQLRRLL